MSILKIFLSLIVIFYLSYASLNKDVSKTDMEALDNINFINQVNLAMAAYLIENENSELFSKSSKEIINILVDNKYLKKSVHRFVEDNNEILFFKKNIIPNTVTISYQFYSKTDYRTLLNLKTSNIKKYSIEKELFKAEQKNQYTYFTTLSLEKK
jgi:hypothetical protein